MEKTITEKENTESILQSSVDKREELRGEFIKQAELIGFKNVPDTIFNTDQFGFIDNSNKKIEDEKNRKLMLRENERSEKWNEMLKDYDKFYKNNFSKLKSRTRKGIPDCFRGIAWLYFTNIKQYYKMTPKEFDLDIVLEEGESIFEALSKMDIDPDTENTILKDIDRTFPKNVFFKDKYGQGQRKLFSVLRAYSIFNKKTGYVQGMGFITALFLTYTSEENTFWLIHSLMTKYNMEGYYETNFPALKGAFFVFLTLLKKYIPKIYELFKKYEIYPSMYASQWFITIFSNCFKFSILVRLFDTLLFEGSKVIFRFALAILKLNEHLFLSCKNFESILGSFKTIYNDINEDTLFEIAFDFGFVRKDIANYYEKYDKLIKEKKFEEELIKQCIF